MNEQTGSPVSTAEVSRQQELEASREANQRRWVHLAYDRTLFHSMLWAMGACITTPRTLMEKEAQVMNAQYDIEHSEHL
jgi:hypothetical protein